MEQTPGSGFGRATLPTADPVRTTLVTSAAVALLAAGAASAALAAPARNPDPKTLVLRLADVPSGFARASGSYVSNAQAAREEREPLAKYTAWGRMNGYAAVYNRSASAGSNPKGLSSVESAASVYRAASGAHAAFAHWVAATPQSGGKVTSVAVGSPLGDESHAFRVESTNGGVSVLEYVVGWRTGRSVGTVTANGTGIDPKSIVDFAKKQQTRMRAAR